MWGYCLQCQCDDFNILSHPSMQQNHDVIYAVSLCVWSHGCPVRELGIYRLHSLKCLSRRIIYNVQV